MMYNDLKVWILICCILLTYVICCRFVLNSYMLYFIDICYMLSICIDMNSRYLMVWFSDFCVCMMYIIDIRYILSISIDINCTYLSISMFWLFDIIYYLSTVWHLLSKDVILWYCFISNVILHCRMYNQRIWYKMDFLHK